MTVTPCRGVFSAFHRVNSGVHRRLIDAAGCSGSNSIFPPGPCCACQPSPHQPPLFLPLASASGTRSFSGSFMQLKRGTLTSTVPSQRCRQSHHSSGLTTILTRTQNLVSRTPCKQLGGDITLKSSACPDSDTSLLSSPCLWPAWQAGARIFCALCSEVRVGDVGRPRWRMVTIWGYPKNSLGRTAVFLYSPPPCREPRRCGWQLPVRPGRLPVI